VAIDHGDPEEWMQEYQQIVQRLEAAQTALKQELIKALGESKGT
jgi:type I restriction enzyme M protein